MKTLATAVKTHWAGSSTTIATCWKATRTDGMVVGLTDHVRALPVSGIKYSPVPGIRASAVKTSSAMTPDNLELEGAYEAAGIAEVDVLSGKWDYARIEVFQVNYLDVNAGTYPVRTGRVGAISTARSSFRNELLGLLHALAQQFGRIYSPTCDAILGDSRCGIDLSTFPNGTVAATVTGVTSQRVFNASALTQPADWFASGLVIFTSGLNSGLSMEVKTFSSAQVGLHLPLPYQIANGDTFTIKAGCDKRPSTCRDKFANVTRIRAHPHVPGTDKMVNGS